MNPSTDDIINAHERIKPYIHKTAILSSRIIDKIAECNLFFKCENFQKVGAFKARGATNAIFTLSESDAAKGVATHSSGNHAAALAYASGLRGIRNYIVMPENSSAVKIEAVKHYGGNITFCKPTLQAREDILNEILEKSGAIEIHPYNNHQIIAGQATACKELLEEMNDLDVIVTPVGGGGLLSGTALSAAYFGKNIQIIAAEPEGADDAFKSINSKTFTPQTNPKTIADGLLTSLGSITFPIILENVHNILTANDAEIISAMKLIWERMKIIVEPSSAVTLAIILKNKELFVGKKVGIILSGGNVDLTKLPW
jgi:threonine dehydratase